MQRHRHGVCLPHDDAVPDSDSWLKPDGAECPVYGSPMWHIAPEQASDVLRAAHRKRNYTVRSAKDDGTIEP